MILARASASACLSGRPSTAVFRRRASQVKLPARRRAPIGAFAASASPRPAALEDEASAPTGRPAAALQMPGKGKNAVSVVRPALLFSSVQAAWPFDDATGLCREEVPCPALPCPGGVGEVLEIPQ